MRLYLLLLAVALLQPASAEARRGGGHGGYTVESRCRSGSCWDRNPSGYAPRGRYKLGGRSHRSRY